MIERYLEDLESRIDAATEEEILAAWKAFSFGRSREPVFSPKRSRKAAPGLAWPDVGVNDALEDFDQMALQQFKGCSQLLADGGGAFMAVRSNYGTGILPSLFGAELFIMDKALNTLPTTRPLAGGKEAVRAWVARGVPGMEGGLGQRTFEMARRYVAMMKPYPKIRKYVYVYHPDIQGPMDVCELLWGSEMFVDLVDEPELGKAFLDLVTKTYTAFMKQWATIVPFHDDWSVHWSLFQKGHIMLRDDSAMNLSPVMFDEFIRPYDQRLLREFGGGAIHFCGRGDHYIESMCSGQGLHAIAMSQPELNNMETIYRNTVDKGIKLIGFSRQAADEALARGRDLHGHVHCW